MSIKGMPHRSLFGSDMDEVFPRLFVGSLSAAQNTKLLRENQISHILTVESSRLKDEYTKDFQYFYIHADDDPDQDLFSYFPKTNQFISDALESRGDECGGVLVHCFVGVSRSATIAAAYIMQREKLRHDKTIDLMREKRFVSPNGGFIMQLRIYEEMNYEINEANQDFKVYRLKRFAVKMKYKNPQKRFPDYFYASDPSEGGGVGAGGGRCDLYKCSKCRRSLFTGESVIIHKKGIGLAAFDWRGQLLKHFKSKPGNAYGAGGKKDVDCTESLFIEPVNWMKETILELNGKLACPKCSQKLGSFSWSGELCPCGTHVTPAFHIHTGKVDGCAVPPAITQSKSDAASSTSANETQPDEISSLTEEVEKL